MFLLLHATAASEGTRQEAEIHLVTHMLPKKMELPERCAEQKPVPRC